jgi:hypothetical protein
MNKLNKTQPPAPEPARKPKPKECIGYPVCDGDLPGEAHVELCPAAPAQPVSARGERTAAGIEALLDEVASKRAAQPTLSVAKWMGKNMPGVSYSSSTMEKFAEAYAAPLRREIAALQAEVAHQKTNYAELRREAKAEIAALKEENERLRKEIADGNQEVR